MKVINQGQFFSREEIERRAMGVLTRVNEKRKRPLKWPIDAGHVAEALGLDMDCGYIPPDEKGAIAAMIIPTERKIIMNEKSLELPKGFEESSIAHEIGHWELHIDQKAVSCVEEEQKRGVEIAVEPFLCRNISSQKGIEWQAQYFAGCLLMPKFKLEELQKGRDLTNWKHLYAMQYELGVTISNLINRLKDLGWIYILKDSKKIYLGAPGANGQKNLS